MSAVRPDYKVISEQLSQFISTFHDENDEELKYISQLREIANKTSQVFRVDLDDIYEADSQLCLAIEGNTRRYISLISDIIDRLMPTSDIISDTPDVLDVLLSHRHQLANESIPHAPGQEVVPRDPMNAFPKQLLRNYNVCIVPRSGFKPVGLRKLDAHNIGKLVSVSGIVTRMSDVKPLVTVATYTCDVCGHEIYQCVDAKEFTPLRECPSARCKRNNMSGNLHLQTRGCKFERFQEVRLQELPDQVPVGNVPRSLTIHMRGAMTRTMKAGSQVMVSGIFFPTPYTGFKRMRAGLVSDTYLECLHIIRQKKSYEEYNRLLSPEEEEEFKLECSKGDIISRMALSIAPEIFGLEDVKTALLLLLAGGVTKLRKDGLRIRGDINVLLMGDPGVAKSQLLKQAASIAPRGVYTTGKGSSGVGLTAAVIKDTVTGEMVLEGGALVLADMGICCIDEFDKMEEGDRTAIHEVMEQQSVSIAKAGVTTSLNARTSILAAANPLYGRYRLDLSPEKNINLPPALMSRFDLIFLLRDVPNADSDRQLAEHILFVHQNGTHPAIEFDPFPTDWLRKYISYAQRYEPTIPETLTNRICEAYVQMRADGANFDTDDLPCTPRVLLSMIRLSQATARLRLHEEVDQIDVDNAIRLMTESTRSTRIAKARAKEGRSRQKDITTQIWEVVKGYAQNRNTSSIRRNDLLNHIRMKGFSQEQFDTTIAVYDKLNVLTASASHINL